MVEEGDERRRRVLSTSESGRPQSEKQPFATGVLVNLYTDSLDGSCEKGSLTCNLRAAVAVVSKGDTPVLISLPNEEAHKVTEGQMLVAEGKTVMIMAIGGAASIHGSQNGEDRLFHVSAGADLRLSYVTISGFSSSAEGGAILNEGDLRAYHTSMTGNSAQTTGAAVHNKGRALFWLCSFDQNEGQSGDVDVYNERTLLLKPCSTQVAVEGVEAFCGSKDQAHGGDEWWEDAMSSNEVIGQGEAAGEDELASVHRDLRNDLSSTFESIPTSGEVITVTSYEDSLDGDCSRRASMTCNLRAAVLAAVARGEPTRVILPTKRTHQLVQGPLVVPDGAEVELVTGVAELATVQGPSPRKGRFIKVRDGGAAHLRSLNLHGFSAWGDGSVIQNAGDLTLDRVDRRAHV